MRFLIRALSLCTLFGFAGISVLAQRGGAGRGYAAPPAARGSTPFRGSTPYGGHPYPVPHGYPAPLGLRAPAAGYTGIRPGAFRSHGRYGRDYRRVPYSYFFTPYYYPFFDYGSGGPYFDSGYEAPPDAAAQGDFMAENALGEQVQRLAAEVDQMKYTQQSPAPSYTQQDPQQPPAPPVMLILRNGQQLQVQSYAVMDHDFWDFTRQPARKIPVSSIDIAASARATQAKGGEFPQIESGQ